MRRLLVVSLTCAALIGGALPGVVGADPSIEHEYRVLWAAQGSRGSDDFIEVTANLGRINELELEPALGAWSGYGIVSVETEQCRVTTLDVADLRFSESGQGASLRWDSDCGLVSIDWQADSSLELRPTEGLPPDSAQACAPDSSGRHAHISEGHSKLALASGSVGEHPFASDGAWVSFGKWRDASCG